MASSRIDALMERLSEYVLPLPCDGSSLITGQDLERRRTRAGPSLSLLTLLWFSQSHGDGLFPADPFPFCHWLAKPQALVQQGCTVPISSGSISETLWLRKKIGSGANLSRFQYPEAGWPTRSGIDCWEERSS